MTWIPRKGPAGYCAAEILAGHATGRPAASSKIHGSDPIPSLTQPIDRRYGRPRCPVPHGSYLNDFPIHRLVTARSAAANHSRH